MKPNDSSYWKTYIPLKVNNEETGNLRVKNKVTKSNKLYREIDIILSEIPSENILWSFHDVKERKNIVTNSKDIKKIMSINDNNERVSVKLENKKIKVMDLASVIHTRKYFEFWCNTIYKTRFKAKKIPFHREILFKYSRQFAQQKEAEKKAKSKFGANTIIKESAPINSRYFNQNQISENGNNYDDEIIPNHPTTTTQLLSYLNLKSIPSKLLQPPQRRLLLEDIKKYQLILIVGPSGSGKSTLLKSLHSQNPQQITFKNPEHLKWNNDKCIISQFDDNRNNNKMTMEKAMKLMSSIGLNNIRTWLKPFYILSQGEQYRAAFARLLYESQIEPNKIILMDEFTSVLDRVNSRCMSLAINKCIRQNKNKTSSFILASGNSDIIRYLQPDLLILLGGDNEMKQIINPNNISNDNFKSLIDIKCVLDLPQFAKRKEERIDNNQSISKLMIFDGLQMINKKSYSVDKQVRELKCKVIMDKYAKDTSRILDVEDFNGETITHIPYLQKQDVMRYNKNFNIGIIIGPSGSGKTTSGQRIFGRPIPIKWDKDRNIASHFKSIDILLELLYVVDLKLNVAFSYFDYLSEGEKHRINIARYLQNDKNVIIDEFTSFLDRHCAKKVAKNISDYIYKHDKKNIVFLCCKYDIISSKFGLHPSWIFDVQNKKITHYQPPSNSYISSLKNTHCDYDKNLIKQHKFINIDENAFNPPKIRLVLKWCSHRDFSPTFSKYHYMDATINCNAKCFSVWAYFGIKSNNNDNNKNNKKGKSDKEEADDDEEDDDEEEDDSYYDENKLELVGFTSILNHYGTQSNVEYPFDYREHRSVILPSFQGIGFGSRVADCLGEYLSLHGLRLHSKTAHPRYGGYRDKKPSLWIATKNNHKIKPRNKWTNALDRCLFGNELLPIGLTKKFYIHVYSLQNDPQRTNAVKNKLKQRVIINRKYRKINK